MRPILVPLTAIGLLAATSAHSQDDFLEDGGGITSGYDIGLDREDDVLLGGPDIGRDGGRADGEFLGDGGGITNDTEIFTSEREEFLEDGGGITTSPNRAGVVPGRFFDGDRGLAPSRSGGWRVASTRNRAVLTTNGSIVAVSLRGTTDTLETDTALRDARAGRYANPGPKVIDVESERLDRRPYPPSGLDVIVTGGGSKIIRISPDY
ncbi:hypothetical protein DYI37_14815 [Fulvimarina endophytica]|uniref:Uncharacterized protein n=1 Tax=Fulvimarina endophytica TaxID=2293836 RepID=A0A371X008_9HYPH|nr:hypothetical protein [Fulvimarina endophytica]RFC62526.1 hypothetical protein DYI37_14815 [Fulvimarina endophytica]